jgi:hypothetical protein
MVLDHPGDHDVPEGGVGLAVTAAVESVTVVLAAAGWVVRRHRGERRPPRCEPLGIVAGGDEERRGAVGPDAEGGDKFGRGLFDQRFEDGVDLGDLLFEGDGPPSQHPKGELGQRDDVALDPGRQLEARSRRLKTLSPRSSARMDSGRS